MKNRAAELSQHDIPPAAEIVGRVIRLHCSQCRVCATAQLGTGRARRRAFVELGWANLDGKEPICPDCVDRRRSTPKPPPRQEALSAMASALVDAARPQKDTPMPPSPKPTATVEPIRQMTAEDGRRIFEALQSAYDAGKGLYLFDGSDEAVAKDLGVMWGWVREVREKFFGPGGESESSAAAVEVEDIRGMLSSIDNRLKKIDHIILKLTGVAEELVALRERLVPELKVRVAKLKGKG